jgi:general secretion pathway protein G
MSQIIEGSPMMRMRTDAGAVARASGLVRRGFTLIEIMVVIVVIAIIAAMVAPNVFKNVDEARVTSARAQMSSIATALDLYKLHNHRYPTTEQGLNALWEAPTLDPPCCWKGPYIKRIPTDPWKNAFVYIAPGQVNVDEYDLTSLGADGEVGGEGTNADLNSWEAGG